MTHANHKCFATAHTPRRCTIRINPAAATLIGAGLTLAVMFAGVLL